MFGKNVEKSLLTRFMVHCVTSRRTWRT